MPFLDHLVSEMKHRFGSAQQKASKLHTLLPGSASEPDDVVKMYEIDLPSPDQIPAEMRRWNRIWENKPAAPCTLMDALKECDQDVFPNRHVLLRIGCTVPVSSAENERSNSVVKRLKTYLRSTMREERLSSLALMQIHQNVAVDFSKVTQEFAERYPRRMLLADPMS